MEASLGKVWSIGKRVRSLDFFPSPSPIWWVSVNTLMVERLRSSCHPSNGSISLRIASPLWSSDYVPLPHPYDEWALTPLWSSHLTYLNSKWEGFSGDLFIKTSSSKPPSANVKEEWVFKVLSFLAFLVNWTLLLLLIDFYHYRKQSWRTKLLR